MGIMSLHFGLCQGRYFYFIREPTFWGESWLGISAPFAEITPTPCKQLFKSERTACQVKRDASGVLHKWRVDPKYLSYVPAMLRRRTLHVWRGTEFDRQLFHFVCLNDLGDCLMITTENAGFVVI